MTNKIDLEPWVDEVCALMEAKGFWPLVERDKSLWGSVYITACLPPMSMGRKAVPTSILVRVADHASRRAESAPSVHPGGLTPAQAFRIARERSQEKREERNARVRSFRS